MIREAVAQSELLYTPSLSEPIIQEACDVLWGVAMQSHASSLGHPLMEHFVLAILSEIFLVASKRELIMLRPFTDRTGLP